MRFAMLALLGIGCQFQSGVAPAVGDAADPIDAADATQDATPDAKSDAPPDADIKAVTMVQALMHGYATNSVSIMLSETTGDLLVAAVYSSTGAQITLTDTAGLVWTSLPAIGPASGCAPHLQLWYAPVTSTTNNTVTASQNSAVAIGMHLIEYAGVNTSSPIDVSGGVVASAPSHTATTGPITTTTFDAVVGLLADLSGGGAMVPATGWTARGEDLGFYTAIVDDAAGVAAGTYAPSATLPGNISDACWAGAVIALRAR